MSGSSQLPVTSAPEDWMPSYMYAYAPTPKTTEINLQKNKKKTQTKQAI